jgi:hypothetical protein
MIATDSFRKVMVNRNVSKPKVEKRNTIAGTNCRTVISCPIEDPLDFALDNCSGWFMGLETLIGASTESVPGAPVANTRVWADSVSCTAAIGAEIQFKPAVGASCAGVAPDCYAILIPFLYGFAPAAALEVVSSDTANPADLHGGFTAMGLAETDLTNAGAVAGITTPSFLARWSPYVRAKRGARAYRLSGPCPAAPVLSCNLQAAA